jgi:hypothetical protein
MSSLKAATRRLGDAAEKFEVRSLKFEVSAKYN